MKRRFDLVRCILLVFYIPLYFILEASNEFWHLIPLETSIRIGAIAFFSVFIGYSTLLFLMRKESAALIICWFAINYFYFSIIYKAIVSIAFFSFLKPYMLYLPLLFLASIVVVYLVLKMKADKVVKLLSYFAVVFSVLMIIEIYKLAKNLGDQTVLQGIPADKVKLTPNISLNKPDVFLLVMDEYAGFEILKHKYNYDNASFANRLESMGFFVAKKPIANYNGTLFSTSSLLNMAYLDNSLIGDVQSPKTYGKVAKEIEQNILFNFFRKSGYKIVNNSFLRIANTPTKPFVFLPIEGRLVTDKTFGNALQSHILLNVPSNRIQFAFKTIYAQYELYNQRVIKEFNSSLADTQSPLFIYSHLLIPHGPYLHTDDGQLRRFSDAYNEFKSKKYRNSYLPYLKYCNKVVIDMISSVQKRGRDAVIVVVSDHGNRFLGIDREINDDFLNFTAVYTYDKNYNGFTDTISLVNVWRVLLKNHFGQSLNTLPNKQINVTKGVLN